MAALRPQHLSPSTSSTHTSGGELSTGPAAAAPSPRTPSPAYWPMPCSRGTQWSQLGEDDRIPQSTFLILSSVARNAWMEECHRVKTEYDRQERQPKDDSQSEATETHRRTVQPQTENVVVTEEDNKLHVQNEEIGKGSLQCAQCPFSSNPKPAHRSFTASRHATQCNGIRPFVCSGCNFAFAQQFNCIKHIQRICPSAHVVIPEK